MVDFQPAGFDVRFDGESGLAVVERPAAGFHVGFDGEGVPCGHDVFSWVPVWIL